MTPNNLVQEEGGVGAQKTQKSSTFE